MHTLKLRGVKQALSLDGERRDAEAQRHRKWDTDLKFGIQLDFVVILREFSLPVLVRFCILYSSRYASTRKQEVSNGLPN